MPFEAKSTWGKFAIPCSGGGVRRFLELTVDRAPYVVQRSAAKGTTLLKTASFIVCNRMQKRQDAEYFHRKGKYDEGVYMLLTAPGIC